MDKLPITGYWWLPESSNHTVPGTLESRGRNLSLELMGDLRETSPERIEVRDDPLQTDPVIPLILGVSKGKLITLVQTNYQMSGFSVPGYLTFRARPKYLVTGRHVTSLEDDLPIAMRLEYSGLNEWLQLSGISRSTECQNEEMSNTIWQYSYPDKYQWEARDFEFMASMRLDSENPRYGFTASEHGYIRVKSSIGKDFETWVSQIVYPLREMLGLAMLGDINIKPLRVVFPDQLENGETGPKYDMSTTFHINGEDGNDDSGSVWEEDFLFRAKDMTSEILKMILDTESDIFPLRETFLRAEREPMYDTDRFLAYIRILESLDRRLNPVAKEDIDRFREELPTVLEAVPESHRDLVAAKMRYAYQPGLPKRIHRLLKPWKPILVKVIGGKALLADEVCKIAKERDNLAHLLSEADREFDTTGLRRATSFLGVINRLVLLHNAGFGEEVSGSTVEQSRIFSDFRRLYRDTRT